MKKREEDFFNPADREKEHIHLDVLKCTPLHEIIKKATKKRFFEVETVSDITDNDVILDIRSIDEQEERPLQVDGAEVITLPFYNLATKFFDLDQNKTWLLWCERGIMSRLQAIYLSEKGYSNVKVYRYQGSDDSRRV